MAADSAGGTVTTVVTCEGDLNSPSFRAQFAGVLGQLEGLLGEPLTVRKLEPWNSVRVTLSIPREAALRLRQLANDGNQRLRALGILSVQVEGDQVISLRLAGNTPNAEPQEIVLRTSPQDGPITPQGNGGASTSGASSSNSSSSSSSASSSDAPTTSAIPASAAAAASHEKVQFRSPNVVCPSDSIVPKVPVQSVTNNAALQQVANAKSGYHQAGPFPFTSMNQAMHSNRDTAVSRTAAPTAAAPVTYAPPPPPYPGKHPPVTLSSPLLVNLLQNEGAPATTTTARVEDTSAAVTAVTVNHMQHRQLQVRVVNNVSVLAAAAGSNSKVSAFVKNIQSAPASLLAKQPLARNPVPYSYPPPYPNATTTQAPIQQQQQQHQPLARWEQTQQMPQLQDLTATLTDFKQTDLDDLLLPNLSASPLDIPDVDHLLNETPTAPPQRTISSSMSTVLLINPLTGELEPQIGADSDEDVRDVFTGLPLSPIHFSDEDTNSTIRPDTTDQSDSESRSCHSDSSKHSKVKVRTRDKSRDSPSITKQQAQQQPPPPTEKIKLRLKLEKSEPVNAVYKADVSFINAQLPKKAAVVNNLMPTRDAPTLAPLMTSSAMTTSLPPAGEEPRVPPLHISLRGRHVVINNKKKMKLAADGITVIKTKPKRLLEYNKLKRERSVLESSGGSPEDRKLKVPKLNDKLELTTVETTELVYNNHIQQFHNKDKLKERRGSDSELARNSLKYAETNGTGRRLSQSDDSFDPELILGSTNIGTVAPLPNKIRNKDNKFKSKENFKSKDLNRFKSYAMNKQPQIALPTNEIDMEARFKERLLKIEDVQRVLSPDDKVEELIQTLEDQPASVKDKPPEPDKCNTPDRTSAIKQQPPPNRSPNSGAGQGEDSGIESMDALSEKSPNQASQSPHAEIISISEHAKNHKTQVPDMLDIEAQLAKMEGMHADEPEPADGDQEDLNENHRGQTKLEQCCVLTSALQDNLVKKAAATTPVVKVKEEPDNAPSADGKEEEPLPLRVTPPLYTYSNPEKRGADSPTLSDSEVDSNSLANPIRKSLLEQLLIEIPESQTPSSPSPATRSVRTRASSKLNSPELLNSPVVVTNSCNNTGKLRTTPTITMPAATPTMKRKRHESDSSNNSLDVEQQQQRSKKPRKSSENAVELIKACMDGKTTPTTANAQNAAGKKKMLEESSDSDEPLIEVAGKVRKGTGTRVVKVKSNNVNNAVANPPVLTAAPGAKNINTRRSVRALPVINTRSKGDKSNPEGDVVRRKTRSAVSEGEGKRRKDVK